MEPEDFREPWIKIADLDPEGRIKFRKQYLEIMGELGWQAKAFAAHLITQWRDEYEHALDNHEHAGETGNDEFIDVANYWAEHFSQADWPETILERMSAHWYGDVYRAKLLTIALPKRLLVEYRNRCCELKNKILD